MVVAAQKCADQMAGLDDRLIEIEVLWDQDEDRTVYPFNIPAIASIECLDLDWPVTFLAGEIGSGTSTLLEAIAVGAGLDPEGGSRNLSFSTNATYPPHPVGLSRGTDPSDDGGRARSDRLHRHRTVPVDPRPSLKIRSDSFVTCVKRTGQLLPSTEGRP